MEHSLEETESIGLGGGELCFQLIAHAHKFIDLGDDAVLFGEWWKGNDHVSQLRPGWLRSVNLCFWFFQGPRKEFQGKYRPRSGIESTNSLLKRVTGLGRLRVGDESRSL